MRRGGLLVSAAVLALVVVDVVRAGSPELAPQQGEVSVRVSVTEKDGVSPVTRLTAGDFEIRSDGLVVPVLGHSLDSAPLALVVLVDATWTMAVTAAPFEAEPTEDRGVPPDPTDEIKGRRPPSDPVSLFLNPIRSGIVAKLQEGDRVRFGSIARRLRLTPGFARMGRAPDAGLLEVLQVPERDRYGPTPIWDAIHEATTILAAEPGRRAIVLSTDGASTGNRHGLLAVTERAALAGTAVYVVREHLGGTLGMMRMVDRTDNPWILLSSRFGEQVNVTMRKLADATGGRYSVNGYPAPDRGLKPHLARIMGQLHASHAIRFAPPTADGGAHRLEVRVKTAGLNVAAPAWYRAPAVGR
jgi:hypothetical protein